MSAGKSKNEKPLVPGMTPVEGTSGVLGDPTYWNMMSYEFQLKYLEVQKYGLNPNFCCGCAGTDSPLTNVGIHYKLCQKCVDRRRKGW